MEDTAAPETQSPERGVQEGYSNANVVYHPAIPIKRLGILSYRQQRTPGEICNAITNALDREARLARATGINTPPEVLTDLSAWVGRGCLP